MHELFISAAIPNDEVQQALTVLQGLCGMNPVHRFERILTYEGPKSNPLVPLPAALLQNRQHPNYSLWRELNEQLIRSSYYVNVVHEVTRDHFGASNSENSDSGRPNTVLDAEAPGSLHFVDWPDPPGTRTANSRLVVRIREEPNLPSVLKKINYIFRNERIRESYTVCRDHVSLVIFREIRKAVVSSSDEEINSDGFSSHLFPLEEYAPFDGENKWILSASVEVPDEKQSSYMQRGFEELQLVKADLGGLYDFKLTNRRLLDTRVSAYLQSMRT